MENQKHESHRQIVVSMEATSLISAFESMKHINGNVTVISFDKDGFKTYTTTETNQDSTPSKKKVSSVQKREVSQFNGIFSSEWLGSYYYDPKLGKSYTGSVNTTQFMSTMKNLKKEILDFSVNRSTDGTTDKIHIKVPKGSGEKYVDFDTSIDQVKYIDLFNKYYANVDPIAKPFNKTFQTTCSGIRQTNCSRLRFNMNIDKNTLGIVALNDGDTVLSRETLSHNNEPDDDNDTIVSIEVPADCWIIKVPKLSVNACTHIYMSEEKRAPLLFKTHIGAQGFAICSIRMK
jgi:hypothetical protein